MPLFQKTLRHTLVASIALMACSAVASAEKPARPAIFDYAQCADRVVEEMMALSNAQASAQNWAPVALEFQDKTLGRCETREEVSNRVLDKGHARLQQANAAVLEERVLCDLTKGHSFARRGWVCELWVRAKLPNGRWASDSTMKK